MQIKGNWCKSKESLHSHRKFILDWHRKLANMDWHRKYCSILDWHRKYSVPVQYGYCTGTEIFSVWVQYTRMFFYTNNSVLDSHRIILYLYCTRTEKFLCQSSILRGCVTIHFDCSLRGPSLKLTTRGSQKYATRNWRQYICATFRCL